MDPNTLLAIIAVVAVITGIVSYFVFKDKSVDRSKDDEVITAEKDYRKALRGNDKAIALESGRQYYRLLRGKAKYTAMYDEIAMANDLAAMR